MNFFRHEREYGLYVPPMTPVKSIYIAVPLSSAASTLGVMGGVNSARLQDGDRIKHDLQL